MKDMYFLVKAPEVRAVAGRISYVLDQCKGKIVLHLGCADEGFTSEKMNNGNLLHQQISKVANETWGVDYSEEGIKLLRKGGFNNLFIGDLEKLSCIDELKAVKFDIILLTEVLEHLNNPSICLQEIKKIFKPETRLIITVPNGLSFSFINPVLRGYESVHPDHNYWFSYKTLKTLLEKNGYIIEEMLVYTPSDYRVPIHKQILKKFTKKQVTDSEKNNNYVKKSFSKQRTILEKITLQIDLAIEYLFRKYLYNKGNRFFVSDGIIAVVKIDN